MSFGERITYIRGSLSQEDFGVLLGAHRNTVRARETNKSIPVPYKEIITEFHEIFNVNLNWLFTGKGDLYLTDLN